jgi:hypothetical protein
MFPAVRLVNAITTQTCIDRMGTRRLRLLGFLENWHIKVAKLSAHGSGRIYLPEDITGNHFCQQQGQSAAGTIKLINISMTHWESNPQTFSLKRSSSNNCVTAIK